MSVLSRWSWFDFTERVRKLKLVWRDLTGSGTVKEGYHTSHFDS